jgi:hypothetical protein
VACLAPRVDKELPDKTHRQAHLYTSLARSVPAPTATPVSPLVGRIGARSMPHASHRLGPHPTHAPIKGRYILFAPPLSVEGVFPDKHRRLPYFLPLSHRRYQPPSPVAISLLEEVQEHPKGKAQLTGAAAPPSLHRRAAVTLSCHRQTVHMVSRWPTLFHPLLLVASPTYSPSSSRTTQSSCSCCRPSDYLVILAHRRHIILARHIRL